MEEKQWGVEEIRQLLKKQLLKNNIIILLIFALYCFLLAIGNFVFFIAMLAVILWILFAILLYSLTTGKRVGTKNSIILQEFYKNHNGPKRWKRKKIIEIVLIGIISISITSLIFIFDFHYERAFSIFDVIPYIGAWIGYNIAEIYRLNNL